MKLLITLSLMWFSIANLQAQSISHIVYHHNNRKGYHVDQSFTLYIRYAKHINNLIAKLN